MMSEKEPIIITIPYNPVAKGRARQGRGHHYTPEKTRNFEALVEDYGRKAMGKREPFLSACQLHLHLYLQIPESWSLKKREEANQDLILPKKKPDSSNILKAIEDGLNEVVWKDDSQIVDHLISKRYSIYPRICIKVIEL